MECHKLTDGENGIDCNRVDELCTKQEEADTRAMHHPMDMIALLSSPPIQMWMSLRTFSHSI